MLYLPLALDSPVYLLHQLRTQIQKSTSLKSISCQIVLFSDSGLNILCQWIFFILFSDGSWIIWATSYYAFHHCKCFRLLWVIIGKDAIIGACVCVHTCTCVFLQMRMHVHACTCLFF
jgi:hypothetical protein